MKKLDLSLYLVLDPDLCGSPDGMVQTARLAAENGATAVQLRAPHWKKKQWLETAHKLKAALSPLGVPLIINDQVDVALAADADGVHVGQDDLPAADVRRLIGPDKLLGVSVSDFSELAAVPATGVDYLGVGPVFPTGTKPDAGVALGIAGLGKLAAATALPVVAIGGINSVHCGELLAAGARGVAVVSAICGQPDPAQASAALAAALAAALKTALAACRLNAG